MGRVLEDVILVQVHDELVVGKLFGVAVDDVVVKEVSTEQADEDGNEDQGAPVEVWVAAPVALLGRLGSLPRAKTRLLCPAKIRSTQVRLNDKAPRWF